jgi:antitoxin (DNA-binding transcriptional repressor) of toxin-antitoxin stability system
MISYSVVEAKNQLSELIDRALGGDDVVITRHGRPVVELKAIPEPAHAISPADLDWLAEHRIGRAPANTNAGELLSTLRDEEQR